MKKKIEAMAVAAILLIVATVGLYLWANEKIIQQHGPNHIDSNADSVMVADHESLYFLDHQGRFLYQLQLGSHGLPNEVMALQLLKGGDFLIASYVDHKILYCTGEITPRCDVLADVGVLTGRFFKFALDERSGVLYLAATHQNRLYRLESPYSATDATEIAAYVLAPNKLQLTDNQQLWIANTDRHEVIVLDVSRAVAATSATRIDGNAAADSLAELPFRLSLYRLMDVMTQQHYSFPLDLAAKNPARQWVLFSGASYMTSVIAEFDEHQQFLRQISLPDGSGPVSLANLGDGLLVADMRQFRVYQAASSSDQVAEFGDSSFRQLMAGKRKYYQQYDYFRLLAWPLGIISALIFSVVIILGKKHDMLTPPIAWKTLEDEALPEAEKGIIWLQPSSKAQRFQNLARSFIIFASIVISGVSVWLALILPTEQSELLRDLVEIVAALSFLMLVILFYSMPGTLPDIGSGFGKLFIRYKDKSPESYWPEQITYSKTGLLVGSVYLRHFVDGYQRISIYPQAQRVALLEPLLEKAHKGNALAIYIKRLQQKHAPTIIVSLAMGGMLCILGIIELYV